MTSSHWPEEFPSAASKTEPKRYWALILFGFYWMLIQLITDKFSQLAPKSKLNLLTI